MSIPMHVAVLQALLKKIENRKVDHLTRMGKGVQSFDEYNKLVGRCAECDALASEVEELIKRDDDYEGEELDERPQRRSRRAS